MGNKQDRNALSRYETCTGELFPCEPVFEYPQDERFIAYAKPDGNDGIQVVISTGVEDRLFDLWHKAIAYSNTLPDEDQLNFQEVEQAIEFSMQWLMLHELHHFQMGHFKLNGGACLVENSQAHSFALVTRSQSSSSLLEKLPAKDRLLASRCLELQADHDSTEMLLDAYSTDGWPELRFLAACTFAMMVLIEQQERLSGDDEKRTHPKAATRIFQMLGYLSVMWTVPAKIKAAEKGLGAIDLDDLPSDDEVQQFHAKVVLPAFMDALLIAKANDAQSIVADLGDPTDLMNDIAIIHGGDTSQLNSLKSSGAIEYAELAPLNAKLIELLELETFV